MIVNSFRNLYIYKNKIFILIFYFQTLDVAEQAKTLAYDLSAFLSPAERNLGLALGFSFLSILITITFQSLFYTSCASRRCPWFLLSALSPSLSLTIYLFHSLSLSLTIFLTLSFSLSLSLSLPLSLFSHFSLSHSLFIFIFLTLSLSFSLSHFLFLTLSLSISLSLSFSLSLYLSHFLFTFLTLSLSFSLSLNLSHTHFIFLTPSLSFPLSVSFFLSALCFSKKCLPFQVLRQNACSCGSKSATTHLLYRLQLSPDKFTLDSWSLLKNVLYKMYNLVPSNK